MHHIHMNRCRMKDSMGFHTNGGLYKSAPWSWICTTSRRLFVILTHGRFTIDNIHKLWKTSHYVAGVTQNHSEGLRYFQICNAVGPGALHGKLTILLRHFSLMAQSVSDVKTANTLITWKKIMDGHIHDAWGSLSEANCWYGKLKFTWTRNLPDESLDPSSYWWRPVNTRWCTNHSTPTTLCW